MPLDIQALDDFAREATNEVAKRWQQQFQAHLEQDDLERLTVAIRWAMNHKLLPDSNS